MNRLVDEIGDHESHPLMGLLDIVTSFAHDYEARNVEIPDASPSVVPRFRIEQHDLRQADGKREINARQARSLAKRFGVSPAVFI